VKVDFVCHPHLLIRKKLLIDGVRMFSLEVIIALKIQAIPCRDNKKDFWDIAELLNHFAVDDLINIHRQKYQNQNFLITVPQAINYFEDAKESEDLISLKKQNWQSVKRILLKKVSTCLA